MSENPLVFFTNDDRLPGPTGPKRRERNGLPKRNGTSTSLGRVPSSDGNCGCLFYHHGRCLFWGDEILAKLTDFVGYSNFEEIHKHQSLKELLFSTAWPGVKQQLHLGFESLVPLSLLFSFRVHSLICFVCSLGRDLWSCFLINVDSMRMSKCL